MATKYTKRQKNNQMVIKYKHLPLQDPKNLPNFGFFCLEMCHLAILLCLTGACKTLFFACLALETVKKFFPFLLRQAQS
jgi:hypothetical protein